MFEGAAKPPSLFAHKDFMRLWTAQTLSAFGNRITRTAIPVIAVNVMAASPFAVAVLSAAGYLPFAFAGFFGGGFVERSRKRRLMTLMDLLRFVLVGLIPIAAWAGKLDLWLLLVVSLVTGTATALFQNAHASYLPGLVGPAHVVEGNSKLQATDSVAEFAGPGLAGVLIDLLTAPLAVVVDALTFLWSAFWLMRITHVGEPIAAPAARESPWAEIRADLTVGWRAVMGPAPLRAAFLAINVYYIAGGFFLAVYMVVMLRDLGLSPSVVGIIIGIGGVGGLGGAAVAGRLAKLLGFGKAIAAGLAFSIVGLLFVAAAAAGVKPAVPLLACQQLFGDSGGVVFMILMTSLLQRTVDPKEIARANGLFQISAGFIVPVVGLIAGALADIYGARAIMIAGSVIGLFAIVPLLDPRLLGLKEPPEAPPAAPASLT